MNPTELQYLPGFGNTHQSEAVAGALPTDQNSPRKVPFGLFAEQLNGTGFTVRREDNRRTWLYRVRPTIHDNPFTPLPPTRFIGSFAEGSSSPEVRRYKPIAFPDGPTDWLEGMTTFGGAGDPATKTGMAIHTWTANADMTNKAFANIDGDLLLVPESNPLSIQTEMGWLYVAPGEVVIIPRAIRFSVHLPNGHSRGFVAEVYGPHIKLPEHGAIGPNSMANERHFLAPTAAFEDREVDTTIVVKQGGSFWQTIVSHSPFDAVAWYGNYLPYKYDLRKFNSLGSVSFDHPDPSLLTVLTAPHDDHGRAALDVATFIGRWDVAEHTFRPPFFHRNAAIEFNAVIQGSSTGPFKQGTFTWTPYLSPHAVSAGNYNNVVGKTDEEADKPVRGSEDSIWIKFESTYVLRLAPWWDDHPSRDRDYLQSYKGYTPSTLP